MLRVDVLAYSKDALVEEKAVPLSRAKQLVDDPSLPNVWMDIQSLDDEGAKELEETFGIHPLALEDARNERQRSKVEEYEHHFYIVLHAVRLERVTQEPDDDEPAELLELQEEQLNLFFAKNWVLTVHRTPRPELESVRTRVREGRPRIRAWGPDYLATAIMDGVVDGYFPVIEALRDEAETLEDAVMEDPRKQVLARVYNLRRVTVDFRRRLWPARDVVGGLIKMEGTGFQKKTQPFVRDVYDHIVVVLELSEGLREASQAILEVYLSSLSNRTNEIMKVLTIMASIFIPLTFIAGVYGMNFQYMPELTWRYGYFAILGIMLAVFLGMLVYFRRKEWI